MGNKNNNMKTFSRTHLPDAIKYNGRVYYIGEENGYRKIKVLVLNRNLRGKLDLHQKPYKPTEWIFSAPNS